jgi:hypothetical protein
MWLAPKLGHASFQCQITATNTGGTLISQPFFLLLDHHHHHFRVWLK